MDVIIERGCGLDVHKETVVACVMGEGKKRDPDLQYDDGRFISVEVMVIG